MQKKRFTELGLSPEILKAITRIGYEEASPIQTEAIPALLSGVDVVGQSQTGSGKTAAFAIPAIEKVDTSLRAPQVLILCPTRELAVQVAEEVAKLGFFKKGLRELPIYGGQSYERQFRGLQQGAQIIIGTPGRVMDHLERKTLALDKIGTIILDEADRMLDMGFVDDIKTILSQMPKERQTVLFSATLPKPILELIKTFTRNPVNIQIESKTLTVPAIDQVYFEVERRSKIEVLCRLIDLEDIRFGVIFCATKMMVDELTENLAARGYAADKLHGDMTQAMRERVMGRFRKHAVEFLVATDVAARGLDVDDIEVVFNFDLPHDGEDYVHRIGRTGRAGKTGRAITLVSGRETWKLQQIMRFTKGRIRRERVPSIEEVEAKRSNVFFETLRTTLEKGEFKRHDDLVDRLLTQGHNPTDIASALIHLAGGDNARKSQAGGSESAARTERREEESFSDRRPYNAPDKGYKNDRYKGDKGKSDWQSGAERPRTEPRPPRAHKKERDTRHHEENNQPFTREPGMTRLVINSGTEHEINPGDVVGVVAGVAKVEREAIGAIRLMAKHSYVDIANEKVEHVIDKLNGIKFKGRKLHIKSAVKE